MAVARRQYVKINATADGDNTIVAAVSGKVIKVIGYVATVTAAANPLILKSGASGTEHARFTLPINGGVAYAAGETAVAFECDISAGLVVNNPAGVDTLGHLTYTVE